MSNQEVRAERQAIQLGHLLAVGENGRNEAAAQAAVALVAVVGDEEPSEDDRIEGLRHAVSEIGRWALDAEATLKGQSAQSCATCTKVDPSERFCVRIGMAIADGELNEATAIAAELDRRAASGKRPEHSAGISRAANHILGALVGFVALADGPNAPASNH